MAQLILGAGSAAAEASVNKPLASGRDGGDSKEGENVSSLLSWGVGGGT